MKPKLDLLKFMGFFTNNEKESEEIRGVKDQDLPNLTDQRLIMLALARFYEGEGMDDEALIDELYRRGRTLS